MTTDQWIAAVGPTLIATLVPTVAAGLALVLSGLTGRIRTWLDAHGHAQASSIVADASTRVQAAMQNAAGQIALEAQQGTLDLTNVIAVRKRVTELAARVGQKLPEALATLKAAPGAIEEGISGKITAALPVPDPVSAPGTPAPLADLPAAAEHEPDRRLFFNAIRASVFGGRLVQSQVDGCNRILDFWNDTMIENDVRFLAYMLATVFWETAHTMQPVEEIGRGKGRFYGPTGFYGRGLVQLTLEANYRKMSAVAGVDLVANPAKALEWPIALKIMSFGMLTGAFTGKRLGDYFSASVDDPIGARAIINGHDRAEEIAAIYRSFLAALEAETVREAA